MADEPPVMGQLQFPGMESPTQGNRSTARTSVSSNVDISLPKVDALSKSIDTLVKKMASLRDTMLSFSTKKAGSKMAEQIDAAAKAGSGFGGGGTGHDPFGGAKPTVWQSGDHTGTVKIPLSQAVNGAAGAPNNLPSTSPASGDTAAGLTMGQGIGNAAQNFVSNITSGNPMQMLGSVFTGASQMWGSIAGGSLQYAYNRINGPNGNMNAMLQLANALAPNVTMMNAATPGGFGGGQGLQNMIQNLGQQMPVMGTQQDMLQTILAGQSVGALMSGTQNRNGFFESVRQMQALNPGQAPGTAAQSLAGYMSNVGAQQMGVMMGEGAFTMVGQGGRYKTLAEWAEGITKFFEQHRPGGGQGKAFSPEELIAQNFPGSNINAWFQMMGVPQNMVDYWWQYVLTNTQGVPASQITSQTLGTMATATRGINLGVEQLRTATASTQRDYLMGNQMYSMYAANAAANRRFNIAMSKTDEELGNKLATTNIGRMIALLPTPIMEMLMPILTQLVSSPVGAGAAAIGGLIGDPASPAGSYGEAGGTTTAHLTPDLAKRVQQMMLANPNLKMSSGYRDTNTQNRLRRNGVSTVSSPSRSMHTRGWAADIGPASQANWLAQNAGKFGLQTAANFGEPWHIQLAGTQMGDPMPIGDFNFDPLGWAGAAAGGGLNLFQDVTGIDLNPVDALSGLAKDVADGISSIMRNILTEIMKTLTKPMTSFINQFVGSGGYTSMVDTATQMYSKLLTAPLEGFAGLGGPATGQNVTDLINAPVNFTVPVIGKGFTPSEPVTNPTPFGDPMPFGGPLGLATAASGVGKVNAPVIVFHAPITVQGGITSGIDARRTASLLVDHLQTQIEQRDWLKT